MRDIGKCVKARHSACWPICPSNKHSQIISSMHSDVRRMLGKDYRVPTLYYRPNASIVKRARDVPGLVVGLI